MTQSTAPIERYRYIRLRGLVGLGALAIGLFAFRSLFDYDPYVHVRHGSSELEDWFFRPSGNSSVLISGVALCFLFQRYPTLRSAFATSRRGVPAAWLLMAPSAALHAWAIYVGAPDLLLVSFVATTLAAGGWLGGPTALRALLFPILFLLLLVPLPAVLTNQIIYPLQLGSARVTSFILSHAGSESAVFGTFILTPDRIFHVIESCAGMRAIDTLVMSALIYSALFYRGRLHSVILVLSAPLLGLVVNLGRVLSLVLNPYSTIAAVHTAQGVLMLVVGVLLLAGIDRLITFVLRPAEHVRPRWVVDAPSKSPDESKSGAVGMRLSALTALLCTMAAVSLFVRPWQPDDTFWPAPSKLPSVVDGWQSEPLELDRNLMGSIFPNRWTHRRYTRRGETIEFFAASDDRLVRRTSLLSTKVALPEPGLEIREVRRLDLADDGPLVDAFVLEGPNRRLLSFRWYTGQESLPIETVRAFLALDRSALRRQDRAMVFRVTTRMGTTPRGRTEAEERLRDFIRTLRPSLDMLATPIRL